MADIKEALALAGITPSEEEQEIISLAHQFVEKEVIPTVAEYDLKGELNWDAYNKAFEIGLICGALPEAYGGQGFSQVTSNYINQEFMYADAGFGLTANANMLGIKPVLLFGTEEQKKWCVEKIVSDIPGRDPRWPKKRSGFAAFGLTEPDAGSDPAALKTTAVKSEDGSEYVLNGRKCFITNGPLADFFTIVAITDKAAGYTGMSMFLVDAFLPGVDTGHHEDKMGIRTNYTSDVILEDVHVPASALVGKEGMGFIYAMKTLEFGRGGIGAACTGIAKRALKIAAEYSQQRMTKGKPICKQQLIQAKLADMAIGVETMQAIGAKVAACIDAKDFEKAGYLGPIAKTYCSDTLQKVCTDCVQVLGGYGYMRDYPAEKLMRDAKIFQIFEGTNEIQRTIIGGAVVKNHKIG